MLRNSDCLVFSGRCRLGLDLSLIEQVDLIRGKLLAAGRIASGQCEVQLFGEREYLSFVTLILSGELFIASDLIGNQ